MQNKKQFGDRDEDRSVHESHLADMVAYYRRTAAGYNADHGHLEEGHYGHNRAVQELLTIMRDSGSKSLLDVCCGTGRGIKAALENGYDAMGVDVSPDLLKMAHSQTGIPLNLLREADATKLPFPDNSFDVACVFGALHHSAMPGLIVSEVIRVSRRAIVISDGGNTFFGGTKRILIKMGIFAPVYRMIFRRAPREGRRLITSDGDGPTYWFSIEEIVPQLKAHFTKLKSVNSYTIGKKEVWSPLLPRVFARSVIMTVWDKRKNG